MIDGYKELTPVIYGENAIKYLYTEQKKAEGEICFLLHWHDRMELTYVTEGTLRFVTEGEEFLVSAGELAVAGPGQMHGGFAVSEKVCYHTVMFDVERFYNGTAASEKYLRSLGNGELTFVEKIAGKEVSGLLERLVELLAGRDNGKDSKSSLAAIGTLYRIRQVKKQCKGQSGQRVWSDFNLCKSSLYGKTQPGGAECAVWIS